MKTYELSVIAPCLNEEGSLCELVRRLQAVFTASRIAGEIVVVDDGSKDSTGTIADQLSREHENVVVVHHGVNRGIEAGWTSGLAAAHGELVSLIDGDLQNLPEDVSRLYSEMRISDADIVQGYRIYGRRRHDLRYFVSRVLNLMLNTCFRMHLRDNKSGFIICKRELLSNILQHRLKYHYFQSLIMVSAASKGYRIREIETVFDKRMSGSSFIPQLPVKFICKVLVDIAKAFYEYRLCEPQDHVIGDRWIVENPGSSER